VFQAVVDPIEDFPGRWAALDPALAVRRGEDAHLLIVTTLRLDDPIGTGLLDAEHKPFHRMTPLGGKCCWPGQEGVILITGSGAVFPHTP
jgi:hypothetical protein